MFFHLADAAVLSLAITAAAIVLAECVEAWPPALTATGLTLSLAIFLAEAAPLGAIVGRLPRDAVRRGARVLVPAAVLWTIACGLATALGGIPVEWQGAAILLGP